ncbi:MAG: prepilin-type N-terminal cleavage/methylation domain-containing protein [Phycisphaerae bacterium]
MRNMKQGFTLIELLIAIILAAGGLMVLMQLMGVAIFADSDLEYSLIALNLANEKIEELKDDGYSHANLDPASSPFTEASISGFDFVDQRQWTVDYVDANLDSSVSDTGLKDVTVEVQWTQKGGTQSVAVETLIADY